MLFLSLIIILGLWGVNLSPSYIMVSDINKNPDFYIDDTINTMGTVKNGTLDIRPGIIKFSLMDAEDNSSFIDVEYVGNLPPNFMEGQQISLNGKMVSDNEIVADKIVMGCPSKYSQ